MVLKTKISYKKNLRNRGEKNQHKKFQIHKGEEKLQKRKKNETKLKLKIRNKGKNQNFVFVNSDKLSLKSTKQSSEKTI
jgi:hypothetical protein